MVEIIFEGSKVQIGHRVKIPKPIVDTLNLKQGDKILIKFNAEKGEIIIREERSKQNKKR